MTDLQWNGSETVFHVRLHRRDLRSVRNVGQSLIEGQSRRHVLDVAGWDEGGHLQVDTWRRFRRSVVLCGVPANQVLHRLVQQFRVQVESHRVDLSALVSAQQIASAPDFQVTHGDAEPGSQFIGLQDGVDALAGGLGDLMVVRQQQVGVGPVVSSSHPAAQLVELSQPETVGPVDDDGVHVGHVQPGFDDCGADQHVGFPVGEGHHHFFQFRFGHLSVAHQDAGLGHQLAQLVGNVMDRAHPVVQEKHLPVPFQLPQYRLTHGFGAVLGDESLDRQPGFRRGMDHAHVSHAGQGHVQRARDGRGAERHHVHLGAHLLQAFFVSHTESVLLVDDHQPQVFEAHVLLQDAVSADYDIHHAGLGRVHHLVLLLVRPEPAQDLHFDRVGGEPLGEGGVVLLGQHRGRHQDGDLHPFVDRLEGCPQRDFGFAVAHVAADQAVHGLVGFHVVFDFVDGLHLIGRFLVRERVFQVSLPGSVRPEPVAANGFPDGVEPEQLFGNLSGGTLGTVLNALPFAPAQSSQAGRLIGGSYVGAQSVDLLRRDIKPVVLGVFQHQVLPVVARRLQVCCADEPGHTVVDVHHETAGGQVTEGYRVAKVAPRAGRTIAPSLYRAEQLGVAVYRNGRIVVCRFRLPPAAKRAREDLYPARPGPGPQAVFQRRRDPGFLKHLDQSRGMLRDGNHRSTIGDPLCHIIGEVSQPGTLVGQRLQHCWRFFSAPALHAHGGCAGGAHPLGDAVPVCGRRRKTKGQFAPVLTVGPLLLVLRLLLLGLPGQPVRSVHHYDGVCREVIGQRMTVEETVVKSQCLRVRFGKQMRQFFLEPGDGAPVARAQIYPAAAFVEPRGVAKLGELLASRHDGNTVRIAH